MSADTPTDKTITNLRIAARWLVDKRITAEDVQRIEVEALAVVEAARLAAGS